MKIIKLEEDWGRSEFDEVYHSYIYMNFIRKVFNAKPLYYAVVDEDNNIKAMVPFLLVKHILTGTRLVSTPYLEYGEPYGEPSHVKLIVDFVINKYDSVDGVEIREKHGKFNQILSELSFVEKDYYRYELLLDSKENTFNKFSRQRRKSIRRSDKMGIVVQDLEKEHIEEMYSLYVKNMKDFGSPPYSMNYFASFISDIVPRGYGKVVGVFNDNKLISFLLGFTYHESIHITISVYDKEYQSARPNDAVHWKFISWGIENDYKIFDFGRVRPESGQYIYKKQWGGELLKSKIWYYSKKSRILLLDENKISYRIAIIIWRKMPLWLIKAIGPWVRRSLSI